MKPIINQAYKVLNHRDTLVYRGALILLYSIFIVSCNAGNKPETNTYNANNPHKYLSKASTNSINSNYNLGGTYDTMSNSPTDNLSCLNAAYDAAKITITNPQATLDFTQTQSLEQVQRALDVGFAMHISLWLSDINVAYNYARTSQDDAYTLNLNYIFQYSGLARFKQGSLVEGASELIPDARAKVKSSPEAFRQMCGDRYIAQLDAGASVLIRLTLRFNSISEKNYYMENLTHLTGLQNLMDTINKNPKGVTFSLKASGVQVGGKPELLNSLFIANGGEISKEGYPELKCGTQGQNNKCTNIISEVIGYAKEVKQQLQKPEDYYFTNPRLAKFSSIGIYPGEASINPQIIQAMQELNLAYSLDFNDYKFISDYYHMLFAKNLLIEELKVPLIQLLSKYQKVMSLYKDGSYHLNACFNGFVSLSCLDIHNKFLATRERLLNADKLNLVLTYLKDSQYQADLLIDPLNHKAASCSLNPISLDEHTQFAVNCNGQISKGINSLPIIIQKTNNTQNLIISNLAYSYKENSIFNFKYIFSQPLIIYSFYVAKAYIGEVTINSSSDSKTFRDKETISIVHF